MNFADVAGSIAGGLTSGAFGPIFGGLFGLGKQWLDGRQEAARMEFQAKEKAADRAHDLAVLDKEIDKAVLQAESEERIADTNAMVEAVKAQDSEIKALEPALKKSYKWVNSIVAFLLGSVTFLSKTIRPALTIYMMVMATNILHALFAKVNGLDAFSATEVIGLYKSVVYMIIELTGLSFTFWFVARPNNYRK